MIVTTVARVILGLLNALLIFELPSFPDTLMVTFQTACGHLTTGRDILNAFIGTTAMGILGLCLKLVIYSNIVYFTVSLVFFVLKKIPFLGLQE